MQLNDLLDAEVYPGQVLKLPIPKDQSKRKVNKEHALKVEQK